MSLKLKGPHAAIGKAAIYAIAWKFCRTFVQEAGALAIWVECQTQDPDEAFDPKVLGFVKSLFEKHREPTIARIKKLADIFKEATHQQPTAGHN